MHIPAYQIFNVLNAYISQLCGNHRLMQKKKQRGLLSIDAIKLSAHGKRQAIIDKVASDIVNRISRFSILDSDEDEAKHNDQMNKRTFNQKSDKSESSFIFNTIGRNHQKTTRSLSAKDPSVMIAQFEKLAEKSAENSRDR